MGCGHKEKTILYFYGELPEEAAAQTRAHLEACASCAAELGVLKSLSEGFDASRPQAPELDTEALLLAARGATLMEKLMAGFRRAAVAGAFTAFFLLSFQFAGLKSGTAAWKTDVDAGLDNVEYGIYALRDDMAYSSAADFEYGYADVQHQKEQAAQKAV